MRHTAVDWYLDDLSRVGAYMTENLTPEYGIRIFFIEGDYDDFDPIEENQYGYEGDVLWVNNGNLYQYGKHTVERIVNYEIKQERGDNGNYIRVFEDKSAIRSSSDILREAEGQP